MASLRCSGVAIGAPHRAHGTGRPVRGGGSYLSQGSGVGVGAGVQAPQRNGRPAKLLSRGPQVPAHLLNSPLTNGRNVNVIYIHNGGRTMAVILLILGFMWWWPLGLVILAILIAGGRIGCWHRPNIPGSGPMGRWNHGASRWKTKCSACRTRWNACARRWTACAAAICGSTAVERQSRVRQLSHQTLKRLEDEQREFRDFLNRLRFAKDKTEFDQSMADRRSRGDEPARNRRAHSHSSCSIATAPAVRHSGRLVSFVTARFWHSRPALTPH